MLKGRLRANSSKRCKSRTNKQNSIQPIYTKLQRNTPVNELQTKASMKLQELSEIHDNIPRVSHTAPSKRGHCRYYDISAWNEPQNEEPSTKVTKKCKLFSECRTNRTIVNNVAGSSYRSYSLRKQTVHSQRKDNQSKDKSEIMPFSITDLADGPEANSAEFYRTHDTIDICQTDNLSKCLYPLHIFDQYKDTNEIDIIKLRILESLSKQKSITYKPPQIFNKKVKPIRPMTSIQLKNNKSVERSFSGLIRRHHAIRQTLKRKESQKAQMSISKKYESQNKFAQYLYEKYDAVINKLGCIVLK